MLFRVTDMIRATIYVHDVNTTKEAYNLLREIDKIRIIRVKSRMNNIHKDVKMNIIFDN